MLPHDWNSIQEEQLNPLLKRKVIHARHSTVARLEMKRGAVVPEHSHHNEQITLVLSGKLLFRNSSGERIVSAGECLELPPHVPHGVEVLEDSVVLDFFTPRREDWIQGQDAYLRG
jgi:quercetin dioxygenase-like cupin family protein